MVVWVGKFGCWTVAPCGAWARAVQCIMSRVSIGDVAASILDASLPAGPPILARRRGPERRLAEAKAEEREQIAIQKAKRALAEQPHHDLRKPDTAGNLVLETTLRKIATRGVVQLFNAVRTAQRNEDETAESVGRKAKRARKETPEAANGAAGAVQQAGGAPDLSRDSFLDILRRGTGAATSGARARNKGGNARTVAPADDVDATRASFLRDDFMLGRNRARDWEREAEADTAGGLGGPSSQGKYELGYDKTARELWP